jgi:eukaryotic-like serine/threonine-protein kinase
VASTLTKTDAAREATHRLPHLLPGGRALLMTTMASSMGTVARVEWLSLDTGKRKVLVQDGADARYLPSGHLVFVRKGVLMAVPFDLARLETTGQAVAVVPHLLQALNSLMPDMNSGSGQYTVSISGALVWATGDIVQNPPSQFYWVDRRGHAEPWTAFGARTMGGIRISPNGRRVAGTSVGLDRALLVYDSQRNTVTRLTPEGAQGWFHPPFWTPDGSHVVFSWWKANHPNIWQMATDGSGRMEQLTSSETVQRANSLSRDGKFLAFVEDGQETASDIKVLRMSDRQVSPFAVSKASEVLPEFSPDGRWLAYVSNESGRNEVYVRSFPDRTRTLQVSTEGGTSPVWSPDGRELFYWDIAFKKLMRVAVSQGQNLSAGAPSVLFEFAAARSGFMRIYDIAPDGQRFLIQKWQDPRPAVVTEFNLNRNWSSDLNRLSQAGK